MLFYRPDLTDVHYRFLVILSTYWLLLLFISPLTQVPNIVSTQISIFYLPQRLPNSAKKNKHRNKQKRTKLCSLHYYKLIVPTISWSVFEIPGIMVPSSPFFHELEKQMATHSIVLAWRILGTGEPGGLPSMGSHRVGHNWNDLAA